MKFFIRSLFIVLNILALSITAGAQLNLSFSAISGTYTANSSPTILFNNNEDDEITPITPIGFPFVFNGATYTGFYANSNGYILLDQTSPVITNPDPFRNAPALDASDLEGPTLAPLWDDLQLDASTGELNYELTGASPNQVLTIEWKNILWQLSASAPILSFQIKLYEGSNKIQFVYEQYDPSSYGGAASIGLASGVTGDFYSLDQSDASAQSFYGTAFTDITNTPPSGQIFQWSGVEICNNGSDDDGDGLIDCQDPDCSSSSGFTLSSTSVCPGELITITNSNTCHNSFDWDMCGGLSNDAEVISSLVYQNTSLERSALAYDNGIFYVFAVSDLSGHLIKYNFGNSFENTPVSTDLGFVITSSQGVQAIQDGGKWYVFVVGEIGLLRVDFGSDLTSNSPKINSLGNPCQLDWPIGVTIVKDSSDGNWHGYVANKIGNSISYLNFGSSLSNNPTGGLLTLSMGLLRPTCTSFAYDSGQWYGFITDRGNNRILRVDFGTSLNNINPTVTDLGNPTGILNNPYDIRILKFGNKYQGLLTNANDSRLYKVEFPSGLTGSLQLNPYKNLDLYLPQGLSNLYTDPVSQKSYLFVSNYSHNISEVRFETCTGSTSDISTTNPSPVSYNSPGIYTISLTVDKGTPQEKVISKSVQVNSCVENCSNGIDDDGDGLIDLKDSDCSYTSQADFTIQTSAPIVEGEPVVLKTNCVGRTFQWNFCSQLDTSKLYGQKNSLDLANKKFTRITYVKDQNGEMVFTITDDGTLTRGYFNNQYYTSLGPNSAADVYQTPMLNCYGLQVKKDDSGNWFILFTGTYNGVSGIVILPMGNSLQNSFTSQGGPIPPSTNFSSPQGLQILQDKITQNWYGFLVEGGTNTIYRAEFGNSLLNAINFVPLTIPAGLLNSPTSALPVFDNGNFYLFVTNQGNNSIVRLDLGNSVTTNNVTGQTIVNSGLSAPYDISILNDGVNQFGIVTCTNSSEIVRLDFPNGIAGNGSVSPIKGLSNVISPLGISELIRDPMTSDLVGLWVNYDGSNTNTSVLKIPSNCSASIPIYNSEFPPEVSYLASGDNVISVIVDKGTINEKTDKAELTIVTIPEDCQTAGDEDKDGYADDKDPDCVKADFTFSDSVLVNNSVSITNNSQFASTSTWNLCAGTFYSLSTAQEITPYPADFRRIDVAYDESGYYVFTSNYGGGIVCSYLGDSLSGNSIWSNLIRTEDAENIEGVRILKDGNNWYGFFVDYNDNNVGHLWRMSFGHSLKNVPLVENLGNLGLGTFPQGLHIVKDPVSNNWYGLVTNLNDKTITLLEYGTRLANIPKGTNLGNPQTGSGQNSITATPTSIYSIYDNNVWYAFVTMQSPGVLVRLKFGSSLTNNPVADVITGIGGLKNPYDLTIQKQGNVYVGLVANSYFSTDNLVRIDFPSGLDGTVYGTDLGNLGGFFEFQAVSDFNIDPNTGDLIGFGSSSGNQKLYQIKFKSCNASSVTSSTSFNPASYSYKAPEKYAIALTINQGTPQQKSLLKYITIIPGVEKGNCNNGADDDGDGLTDCDDPDCVLADFSGPVNPIFKSAGPTFYQNCNYGGYAVSLEPGNFTLRDLISRGILNDDISSIKIPAGYTVIVYQDSEYNGISYTFTSDVSCLTSVPENINDWISSIQVIPPTSSGVSVCVNHPVTFTNTSNTCSNSSIWDFSDLSAPFDPEVTDAGNLNLSGEDYVNIDAVYDGTNYYCFASSFVNKYIVRSNYGNSITNSPTSDILNFNVSDKVQGVRIMNEGGNWYVFFISYTGLYRLDFGTSLSNAPTYHSLGNCGFNEAHEIVISYDTLQSSWLGFVINRQGQSLIRLNFGNHLTNIPSYKVYDNATYFSNLLNLSTSLSIVKNGGNWYGFIINSQSSTSNLIRFSLGSSLINNPTNVVAFDVSNSTNLYGIKFISDLKSTCAILIDRSFAGALISLQFAGGVSGAPLYRTVYTNNSLKYGQGMSSVIQDVTDGNYYLLVACSSNGNIVRMKLNQFVGADQKFSTSTSPTITFNKIGTFPISLTVNKGTPAEMKVIKQINVVSCTEDCTNNIDDDGNGLEDCLDPQCVIENINFQSNTVCQGEPVTITNSNSCVNSFQWIFDSGITKNPDTLNVGDLNIPGFDYSKVEVIFDGTNYYLFGISASTGEVIQSDFGSSLKNNPTSKSLGIVTTDLEGVQVKEDGGNWFIYVVGNNGLWKGSFGNSLTNVPSFSASPLVNTLASPVGLRMLKDYSTGEWHGYTLESGSNNIHRFDFGASLNNVPSDTIIIIPNTNLLSNPSAFDVIFDQSKNTWYLFVNSDNKLLRLNLGSYLRNNSLAYDWIPYTNLGDFGLLHLPSDIRIINDGSNYVAYVVNGDPNYNTIIKITFPGGLSTKPTGKTVTSVPKLKNPSGLSSLLVDQSTGDQYFFIANTGLNSVAALKFKSDTSTSAYTSIVSQPSSYTYLSPGTYNVQLTVNQGTPLEKTIVQKVTVSEPSFAGNISLLSSNENGGTLGLNGNIGSSVTWLSSNDSTVNFSTVLTNASQVDYTNNSNTYFKAIVQVPGCLADTSDVYKIDRFIIYPTISPNGDNHNDTWIIDGIDLFPNNRVEIFNRWGSVVYETQGYNNNDRLWSGQNKNGGELPDGTYFYSIDLGNSSKPLKGYLILRR